MYSIEVPLFLHKNICCGYSLEVPQRGTSNEYLQHIFVEEIKKNIFGYSLTQSYE